LNRMVLNECSDKERSVSSERPDSCYQKLTPPPETQTIKAGFAVEETNLKKIDQEREKDESMERGTNCPRESPGPYWI